MALNINCNGYLEIDFSSYLVVDNTINFRPDIQDYILESTFDKIPTAIAVNTDNLNLYISEQDYCPVDGIDVPNPCDPNSSIKVKCVTLNELVATGMIGYVVGVDVLDTSSNVIINSPDLKLNYVTTDGESTFIDNEVLALLNTANDPIPALSVTVENLKVQHVNINDSFQYCFSISGTFKLAPKS